MKHKLLILCCLLFCLALIGLASAQTSPDWQIGPGWNGADTPTPDPSITPSPSPTPTATPTSNPTNSASATPLDVVTNVFVASLGAIGMFAVVPIISVAGLILSVVLMMQSGEEIDPKIIIAGGILVIVVNIIAVVSILIINRVHTAMPVTGFLFSVLP
jgi:hypothetical protein